MRQKIPKAKTKTIVLAQKELVGIKFLFELNTDFQPIESMADPSEFGFIELICKNYDGNKGLDLMFAYDEVENRDSDGILYIGHWNDGIVN